MKPRNRKDQNPETKLEIILSKTVRNGDCLEWTGNYFINKKTRLKTYPYIYFQGKVWRGNRLALFLATGELPKDLYALHKCDNKKCINPDHLAWGTHQQNMREAEDRGLSRNAKTTHCPIGHPYRGKNVRINRGVRYCRSCAWYRSRGLERQSEVKYDIET